MCYLIVSQVLHAEMKYVFCATSPNLHYHGPICPLILSCISKYCGVIPLIHSWETCWIYCQFYKFNLFSARSLPSFFCNKHEATMFSIYYWWKCSPSLAYCIISYGFGNFASYINIFFTPLILSNETLSEIFSIFHRVKSAIQR